MTSRSVGAATAENGRVALRVASAKSGLIDEPVLVREAPFLRVRPVDDPGAPGRPTRDGDALTLGHRERAGLFEVVDGLADLGRQRRVAVSLNKHRQTCAAPKVH